MKSAYFIGIGGIGMSGLAQLLRDQGVAVSGSDREESPITKLLASKGIEVVIGQRAENLPQDADVVIFSDAVAEENVERTRAKELGIEQVSYFAMLGRISEGKRTVAVAGTHGKTTTTGMLTKVLEDAGASPTAVVGSIIKDFGSNYVKGTSDLFIVEACEYRDHVLELAPEILVITNLEWDHTDWFPSLAALQETFRKAIKRVPAEGAIVANLGDPNVVPLLSGASAKVVDYSDEFAYDLALPGSFNVQNARAAAAAARLVLPSITSAQLERSLGSFQGTWRRFEYKGKTARGAHVYDDYAHHPTAIRETLKALRAQTKGRVLVAFHPHLYSRTRDLLTDFARAFSDADDVVIAPIYAAREADDGSISSRMLAERIRANGVSARAVDSFDEIAQYLSEQGGPGDAIMTMGAGDIYKVADTLIATH